MFVSLLKSKLHRGRVTSAKVDYPGSIGIDAELMAAAGIVTYEKVLVVDLENGSRLETYAIPADPGSKQIEILGAAARLIKKKDRVIIMGFAGFTPEEAAGHKPKVIVLDENNNIIKNLP
ncbi:MAG: aspartate 1-decarboxylase [Sedimentisphaerales bacterium]|nr:aspartate 1-decarboxylase [Sedimentisphaerales bacterium]